MSWRDRLRPGRFRTAAFHVDYAEESGGRRDVLHEFPQRDDVLVEDLGRGPREFSLDVLVVGDDYMAARDALIEACDAAGTGELVHPWRGTTTAWCRGWRMRETSDEGGIARFTLTFTRAPAAAPAETAAPLAGLEAAAAASAQEGLDGLTRGFSVAGLPGHLADGAAGRVQVLADALGPSLARLGGLRDRAARAALMAAELRSRALELVRTVPNLGGAAQALIAQARLLASTPRAAFRELIGLIGFSTGDRAPGATPARLAEAANADALERLVALTAAAEAARAAATVELDSYEDARALRDELADALDARALALADAGDDAGHARLTALRLAAVRVLSARGATLARVYAYAPARVEPALVIAHRLYGDATRAEEIVRRNRLRRPDFVDPSTPLEVLTDV
jgi:prophage DNA circulation protein